VIEVKCVYTHYAFKRHNPGRLGRGNKKRRIGNRRRVTCGNHLSVMF
jgi:hypothetical protein